MKSYGVLGDPFGQQLHRVRVHHGGADRRHWLQTVRGDALNSSLVEVRNPFPLDLAAGLDFAHDSRENFQAEADLSPVKPLHPRLLWRAIQ